MKKLTIALLAVLVFISQNILADEGEIKHSYTNFCELVTEAMALKTNAQIRHEYIVNNFDKRVGNKDIRDAYDIVFQVVPEKRYIVFKQAIEVDVGSEWRCMELKLYFEQYVSK